MAHHVLKSWPHFFAAIVAGQKLHDMRSIADRTFVVGDTATLQEYDPFKGAYTGREQQVEITFITSKETPCAFSSGWLDKDAAILSLKLVSDDEKVTA